MKMEVIVINRDNKYRNHRGFIDEILVIVDCLKNARKMISNKQNLDKQAANVFTTS